MPEPTPDPYVLLDLPPDAEDAAIRAAFHAKVRAGGADAAVNAAYAAIRDAAARRRRRWCEPTAWLAAPPRGDGQLTAPEPLVRELAFLSDWELGDQHE